MCILKVDNRECLKDKFIGYENIIFENLTHGDFSIEVNDSIIAVIERKTIQDLTASIKDGRYHNQKINLLASFDANSIYYLIEGIFDYNEDLDISINGISKKAIISSIINTMVRDNIKIIFTKNVNDTYNFIFAMFNRIKKDPQKYIYKNTKITTDTDIIKKIKEVNKETCFINQLCQVPDISKKTAKAISIFFDNSSKRFYERLMSIEDEEKLKVLKTIYIEDDSGKRRKISEKVIKNIIQLMF